MKYSILGFNQELVMLTSLTLRDLLILQYIMNACGSPSMNHIVQDEKSYVWLDHKKVLDDIPILRMGEQSLKNILSAMKYSGYIDSIQVANKGLAGSRTYYTITKRTEDLMYSPDVLKKVPQDVPKKVPLEVQKKVPQDNSVNNSLLDNQLEEVSTNVDTEISKEIPSNSIETISHVSINRTEGSISKYNKTPKKVLTNEKPKKKNLWEKCMDEIDRRYKGTIVYDAIVEYLGYRLKSTIHRIGYDGWVGLLNKLDKLGKTDEEKCKIIEQSIKMKWDTFVELKTWNKKYSGKDVFAEGDNVRSIPADRNRDFMGSVIF